jgi:mannose-6-phosphate isomerase
MHIDLALDVIDYDFYKPYKTDYSIVKNNRSELCKNSRFKVNIIDFEDVVICDYAAADSFIAYMCVCGNAVLECGEQKETIAKGETILIPAVIDEVKLIPDLHTRLLEISM